MEETFEQVYADWGEMLYRLAALYLGSANEAEDVLQDVFVKLLSQKRDFRDREHQKRWLIRVTVNLCKDYLRSARRRAPLLLAAVLTALLAVLATAVSADESFRREVFQFFRISTAEQVPQDLGSGEEGDGAWLGTSELEGGVTVQYLRLTGRWDDENGILCHWLDEARTEADFYAVTDQGLQSLESHHLTTTVFWSGTDYAVDLQWAVFEDALRVQAFGNQNWDISYLEGRTGAVLLRLFRDSGEDYSEYAMLLDLSTGEARDIFAGTGAEDLVNVAAITLSSDLRRAIFSCDYGEQLYLCDLEEKTTKPVEEVLGGQVDGIWFIAGDLVGWYVMDENYRYTCSVTDLADGTTTLRFADQPAYQREQDRGVVFLEGRHMLEVREDRRTSLLDLLTGAETPVQDFAYPEGDSRTRINGAGDKILFLVVEMDGEGLGISELTVLDLERGTAAALSREGYDVRHETTVSWFDDDRVVIRSEEADGVCLLSLYRFGE